MYRLLALTALALQAVAGELHGLITDPSGAAVPGASVSAQNQATGLTRTASSDSNGEYRILLLPPGDYIVTAEKQSFRAKSVNGVRVTVGQLAELDIALELGVNRERVEVHAEAQLMETERTRQADTLERESIQNLPINRRDYLHYALLAPGVADATTLADNADFRPQQSPHSGLSFFGSNGRGNFFSVDGGEVNNDTGGVRSTVSQDAVQEFQINRANYSAEFGGATGGVINIVTKGGGNALHGSVFGYFRHDSLDAGNPFARVLSGTSLVRVKPPSHRQQFGANAGGPLRKDKTFWFFAGEGLIRNESSVISLLTDRSIFGPTPQQEAVLSQLPPPAAAELRGALTSPPATVRMFELNSGIVPFPAHNWQY
jgi:hypothetical protein